ncbi:MAG: type IV secretory system conjugative DNA transfer family protein, partial [Pseudomonadota bacterium]
MTTRASNADLFDGFPRGVFEAGGEVRSLEEQAMPRAGFLRTEAVRRSRLLAYDPTKLFLGVVDGQAAPTARVGQTAIQGGQAIGFGDDTHALTTAGNRSGKGRSSIIPTLLNY